MELCPHCGNAFESHNCFYRIEGELCYLPGEFKRWNFLSNYRETWSFLPYSLRHRVAEQLMIYDYLWSLNDWLQPRLTIHKRQKVLAAQSLASIYEGVLGYAISKLLEEGRTRNPLLNAVDFDPNNKTFGPILKVAKKIELTDESWAEYLGKINKIKNWAHLTNDEVGPLMSWLDAATFSDLGDKLNEFRKYIKQRLS